jgi:hypothetical protein
MPTISRRIPGALPILLLGVVGCAEDARPIVQARIVSFVVDTPDADPELPNLQVEGSVVIEISATRETNVILDGVALIGPEHSTVDVEVVPPDGSFPVGVAAGATIERTMKIRGEIPTLSAEGELALCDEVLPVQTQVDVTIYAEADGSQARASSRPVVLEGTERGVPDWGFHDVTLAKTSFSSAVIVHDVAVSIEGTMWMLVEDGGVAGYQNGELALYEVGTTSADRIWSGILSYGTKLEASGAAGPLIIQLVGQDATIEHLSDQQHWLRTISGAAGAVPEVSSSPGRVVMSYPASEGVSLDGIEVVPPTEDRWALLQLDAFDGSLDRVDLIEGGGAVLALADGGIAIGVPAEDGSYVVALTATLEERYRVGLGWLGLPRLLVAGGDGRVLFGTGATVGSVDASGTLEWTVDAGGGGEGSSIAALPQGGAILARGSVHLMELDATGNVVQSGAAGCDSRLWALSNGSTVMLGGIVGAGVAIDGTVHTVEFPEYRALRAVR